MYEFFDKRIDLYFYSEKGVSLGYLATPETGAKPEIIVRGNLITEDTALSLEIVVTNLERDFPLNEVSWIRATMYYGRTLAEESRKSLIMNVLYADQSKGPPNRQVVFKCIVANATPKLLNQYIEFNYSDKEGNKVDKSLDSILKDFIVKCRDIQSDWSAISTGGDLRNQLFLQEAPVYLGSKGKSVANETIPIGYWRGTVYQFLSFLMSQFPSIEKAVDEESSEYRYCPSIHIFFSDTALYVQGAPSTEGYFVDNENAEIRLNHVLSAYRQGPIVFLKTLFDPRIDQTKTITISAFNIGGVRSLGKLVPLTKQGDIKFTPIGGIQFEFGTINGNSMSMQGVFEEVK